MPLEPGTALGPYLIESSLGAGGMGEVYRARDPRLERTVAVKVIAAGACDEESLRRFEQEARATAALSHPNILTVYDVGTHEGAPFLVMELLDGRTLREHLEAGPLAPDRVVELGLQLVRGVAAAHEVKIVHRDLKPENLMLTGSGTLKILDFGLAKLRREAEVGPDARTALASSPGQLLGTLAYMAPEQLRGDPVDVRADLFAIGVVLYEMVSGRSPFGRASAAETVAAVLGQEPEPLESSEQRPLERVVRRCLEKDPAERFQSAADLAFALETALAPPSESPVRPPKRDGAPASIAVLPFTDMSPTRDQDYLCDGLADELINSLSRLRGLRVASRSSSFQFRGAAADIRAVGQRLGVETVVEASVRKIGERLRVNVQLVDVADGYQRWAERYDRQLEDVFAIQDEIAESVATALRGVLSRGEKEALQHPETSIESYEYFLRARQLLNRFDRASLEGARVMFERAIELDPEYAPSWAGLADAHSWLFEWWGGDEGNEAAAERASRRALELAPELAEAHASRGFALALVGRYEEAAEAFAEAVRVNPSLFDALYYWARAAFANGEIERSVELFRRASEVRQEDFQSPILLGQSLGMLGRSEEAEAANREGIRRAERALELNPIDARALSLGANALGKTGEKERALRWSERAVALHPHDQGVLTNAACLRAKLGMKEEALEFLEEVFAHGQGKRDWIEHDPDYDLLRDDPRFQALLAKLH